MARLVINHTAVADGVALLSGAAVVLVLLSVANAFQRADPIGGAGSPPSIANSISLPDRPDSNEQVRLAFHADIETLKAQLANDPGNPELLLDIATKYHDGHKPVDAIRYYEDYLAINETDEQAWLDLASSYAELEDWTEAETATRRLLDVNPSNASALYNLGAIRANRGDFDEARRLWEQVRDEQPQAAVTGQAREALIRLASLPS